MNKKSKAKAKADKAFIAKISSINIGGKGGHSCGDGCSVCGSTTHKYLGSIAVEVKEEKKSKSKDQKSFAA